MFFSAFALWSLPSKPFTCPVKTLEVTNRANAIFALSAVFCATLFCTEGDVRNEFICSSILSCILGDCRGSANAKMPIALFTTSVAGGCG